MALGALWSSGLDDRCCVCAGESDCRCGILRLGYRAARSNGAVDGVLQKRSSVVPNCSGERQLLVNGEVGSIGTHEL